MKNFAALTAAAVVLTLSACDKPADKAPEKVTAQAPAVSVEKTPQEMMAIAPGMQVPAGHPSISSMEGMSGMMGMDGDMPASGHKALPKERGQVISHIDIPQFTYLEVKQDGKTKWLASRSIAVKDGDAIEYTIDSTIDNFTSSTLKRTFDSLTFVGEATVVTGK